jgi:hypothetical protein
MIFEAITFGVIVAFIILGIVGTVVPIVPGTLFIWLGVAVYAWHTGFTAISVGVFIFISLIALVAGTADLWLPLAGARTGGASKRALLFGTAGALIGTFLLPIPFLGTIIGYLLGLLLGEYQKHNDWELAKKASFSGLAGWAVATAVQIGGGIIILFIFVIQVLTA